MQLLRDQERSRAIWHYVQDQRETLLRSLGTHAWCNANEKRNALVREGRKRFKLEADMVQARYLAKAVACRGPADSTPRAAYVACPSDGATCVWKGFGCVGFHHQGCTTDGSSVLGFL